MSTSYKALALSATLADELRKRLSATLSATLVEGFDTNGNPTIAIGTGSPGAKNAFIRTQPISWPLAKDIVGNTSQVYAPSVIQLATETDSGSDILTPVELLAILSAIQLKGAKIEWYQSTNGTAPVVATITGTPVATFDADLYWNMQASS